MARGSLPFCAFLIATGLLALPANQAAATYEDGVAAIERQDYEVAVDALQPLAEAGDPRAQYKLGYLYQTGQGVAVNAGEAARLYTLAAEQNNDDAQAALGVLCRLGLGVEHDLAQAYMWFSLAADRGNRTARFNLRRLKGELSEAELSEGERLLAQWQATHL